MKKNFSNYLKNITQSYQRDDAREERFYPKKHINPLPLEVWEYQIGGYHACAKWLKDHKGRTLSLDEVRTYCRIVTALNLTIDIQEEIDGLYARVEEDVLVL